MAMTSPPYWGLRRYAAGGIGEERRREDYIQAILAVTNELARVLRPQGSLWLNLGDSYRGKGLQGIPWRVALRMVDEQGWILRNEVIWNKVKGGPDPARDKLRPVHEQLFHFVRQAKGYHYDDAAIRQPPKQARVVSGQAVSATGVSGVRYRRQIEGSTALSEAEKRDALSALEATLAQLAAGEIGDFRMVIRRQQRSTHSDAEQVSGRAKELVQRGFYFLRYNPKGSKIGDVWDVIPEDTQARRGHFAPYPEELCRTPILATCPPGGVVLDPFCGTGTTCKVAMSLGRRSVGIDLSADYLSAAAERCSVFGTHCDLDA
ncbi:MAG: site-specific DNA-methyltransferase [Alphaproteobacteria bacterium]|nr:site-specific DNA-methyltransferase [Alphaproteobacteria bacterium]MCB9796255.1 site-specific DNA-methyltransferase [Alphaproteobacteria bacterium]